MKYSLFKVFSIFCLTLLSCEKVIVEVIPSLEYESISIETPHDVVAISFPSNNIGYAGCHTENIDEVTENAYFKTIDGGKNWTPILTEQSTSGTVNGVSFINDSVGLVIDGNYGSVLLTKNGGETWEDLSHGGICTGIDEDGNLYFARTISRAPQQLIEVFKYSIEDQQFNIYTQFEIFQGILRSIVGGRINENSIYIFTSGIEFDKNIYGYNLRSMKEQNLWTDRLTCPTDIIYQNGKYSICSKDGLILNKGFTDQFNFDYYDNHKYDYRSIDYNNKYLIAVGNKTIASNITSEWQEVFDLKGNGFSETFSFIDFLDEQNFVIGGEHGLIWKGTLE